MDQIFDFLQWKSQESVWHNRWYTTLQCYEELEHITTHSTPSHPHHTQPANHHTSPPDYHHSDCVWIYSPHHNLG